MSRPLPPTPWSCNGRFEHSLERLRRARSLTKGLRVFAYGERVFEHLEAHRTLCSGRAVTRLTSRLPPPTLWSCNGRFEHSREPRRESALSPRAYLTLLRVFAYGERVFEHLEAHTTPCGWDEVAQSMRRPPPPML